MDQYRGIIRELYMVQDLTLKEVLAELREHHGMDISPKKLRVLLKRWNFTKNLSREKATEMVRRLHQSRATTGILNTATDDAVFDYGKLQRYCAKNGIALEDARTHGVEDTIGTENAQPEQVLRTLAMPDTLRIANEMFHKSDHLICRSFMTGEWKQTSYEQIISSSNTCQQDLRSLHKFYGCIDMGSAAAGEGSWSEAGQHWLSAFAEVDVLLRAQYHDIIPNVIQKINDIYAAGYHEVASHLQAYIACRARQIAGAERQFIFEALGQMDCLTLIEVEERIMAQFEKSFGQHLGYMHYNSFVMRLNSACRKLGRSPWVAVHECMPNLVMLDHAFAPSNVRALEVLSRSIEVYDQRQEYGMVEAQASELIHRARAIKDDDWQKNYFLVRGASHLATAQFKLSRQCAAAAIKTALVHIDNFAKIDSNPIFEPGELFSVDSWCNWSNGTLWT